MTSKKEPADTMLTARVPASLLKALDKAAQKERRSRSAEVVVRLQGSLKPQSKRVTA